MTQDKKLIRGRERRRHPRGYKSYPVRYGVEAPVHKAIARRPSIGGLFISTNTVVYLPGTVIRLEVEIDGVSYPAAGIVRHSLRVDTRYVRLLRPGMGVEFTEATEQLREAISKGL